MTAEWPRWYRKLCETAEIAVLRRDRDDRPPTPPKVWPDRLWERRTAFRFDPLLGSANIAASTVTRGPALSRSPSPEFELRRGALIPYGTT